MAKQKPEAGAHPSLLDKPRILYSEPGIFSQLLFFGPMFLLGSLGALGCFFASFQVPVDPLPVGIVGAVCLLFSLFLFLFKKSHWILSLCGVALWIGAVWYFFDDLLQGCAHTINLVLEAYGNKFGMALPFLVVDSSLTSQQIQFQCTLSCCLFLFPYLFFLGWVLIGRKSALGAFCLTGLMVLFPMVISLVPPVPYLVMLLLFWAMLLLFSPTFGERHRLLEDRGKFHAGGNGVARPSMLLLFLGSAVLCMALTYCLVPHSTYQRPQFIDDLRDGFSRGFGLAETFQGGVGNGNGRVELSSLGPRSYTGKTMLRVKYEWESFAGSSGNSSNLRKDYLKSFVGSVYTGSSWERLSAQDSGELREILNDEHPQNLLDRITDEFSAYNPTQYHVTVENVGANPRCVYVPYGLIGDSVDTDIMGYVEDGFLQSTQFFSGTPSYQLDAWSFPESRRQYSDVAINQILNQSLSSSESDSSTGNWYSTAQADQIQDLISQMEGGLYNEDGSLVSAKQMDLWTIPETVIDYLEPEQQEFARTLEAYNQFVYDHYTQLPDELRETLLQVMEENGMYALSDSSYIYLSSSTYLIQQVISTLASRCTYTLTPPSLPEGKDFVEYFLFESRQGYCVHFASAAVALLRAAGIPARYAEGYAVPSNAEGWVDVPDYNAHAWVEVYMGGTGWVPIEVTPAGPDAPAATEDARPTQVQTVTPTPSPTPTPTPTPSPTPEATPSSTPDTVLGTSPSPAPTAAPESDGSQGKFPWVLTGSVLGGLILLLIVLVVRRKLLLRLRWKRFTQSDRNQAALAWYAALLELHRTVRKFLPVWQEEIPPQLKRLAQKARFSQHTLTLEELSLFEKEWENTVARLRKLLPTSRKLWCQFGPVLF